MARSISEIQQQIIDTKNADSTLNSYSWSTSNVSMWRLWTYITAVCIWTLENLFDYHRDEVLAIVAAQKPHSLQWYVNKARLFQKGIPLPEGSDTYETLSDDPAVVIVKYAAAIELSNMIRIKAAKSSGDALAPLSPAELSSFSDYMNKIKDAGIRLQVTSDSPDVLQLAINVYYDPLVLSATGTRLDGSSSTPVLSAINAFLRNLPFNGVFILNDFITALQAIEGVAIGHILTAQANYAMTPFLPIDVKYTPDAGYMILDETYFNANVNYLPYSVA
jgi:hypothetical protein